MARSKAKHSHGSAFQWRTDDFLGNWAFLTDVQSISGPDFSGDDTEVSQISGDGAMKEFVPGNIDPGEVTVDINMARTTLVALVAVFRGTLLFRVFYPEGSFWDCAGYFKGLTNETPLNDKISCTLTFKVTSLPIFVEGTL